MSQRQDYRKDFQPEIDYNTLVKQALQTVIELPKISDFISENIPRAGIMRSSSTFSPERYNRAVRTTCFMLVKRLRDEEYDKVLKTEKDPERLWQALMELLDRNGFWQRAKSVSNL